MRPFLISIAIAFSCLIVTATASDSFPMRTRVFCDYSAGVSFRYPYEYYIPDQYVGGLVRDRGYGAGEMMIGREREIDGKKVMVFEKMEMDSGKYDVRCLSAAAGDLTGDVAAMGDHLVAEAKMIDKAAAIEWKPFDYYAASPERPQADPKWALPGIEAMVGEGGGLCGLVAKHGEQVSVLVMKGGLTESDNRTILDSFEILVPKGKEKDKELSTWREGQFRQGKVTTVEGKAQKADMSGKAKPVGWSSGWDIETKHYHVTSDVSQKRLLEYGLFLEALYKAYSDVYDPDQIPPYKMEIHVFTTWEDFAGGAAANGIPVGSSTGGFFVPSLLSIFAFEQTKEHFGSANFTLEVVLAHECSHQFLHCTCNGSRHVPTWINEGLAVLFESGKFQGGSFRVYSPAERIQQLKTAYNQTKSTLWPLGDYLGHYGHIDALQYGEVYAMTHFWIYGSAEGKKRFKEYWLALKAGENGTESFERIFMVDLIKLKGDRASAVQAWQKMLLDYVKTQLK